MARENIEDEDWGDPRRMALIARLGCQFKADGMIWASRRLAGQFWRNKKKPMSFIPRAMWEGGGYPDILFEIGLASRTDSNGNQTDSNDRSAPFIYVEGTLERNAWHFKNQSQQSEAGKKSAKARLVKTGSAQPMPSIKPNEPSNQIERVRTTVRTESNDAEPSISFSSSSSEKERENIFAGANPVRPLPKLESEINQDAGPEGFAACETAWLGTIGHLGVERNFLRTEEGPIISQLIQKFGAPQTAKALEGARYEGISKTYDPRTHVNISRAWKRFSAWADMADNPSLRESAIAVEQAIPDITKMLEQHEQRKQAVR